MSDTDLKDRVRRVKETNDIVDVIGAYVALRQNGETFKGLCPFHKEERPSFDVNPRRQRYRCWLCNKFGDVIQFVQEIERIDFEAAMKVLEKRVGFRTWQNLFLEWARAHAPTPKEPEQPKPIKFREFL